MHGKNRSRSVRQRDRRKILHRIVWNAINDLPDPEAAAGEKQGVTIGRCFGDDITRDNSAWPIVYDYPLAQWGGNSLCNETRRVVAAASGSRGDDADRLIRKILSPHRTCAEDHRCQGKRPYDKAPYQHGPSSDEV